MELYATLHRKNISLNLGEKAGLPSELVYVKHKMKLH